MTEPYCWYSHESVCVFFDAIREGHVHTVQDMLKQEPCLAKAIDEYGFSPLMAAVSSLNRRLDCVKLLLEAGADVNYQTTHGYTALHCVFDVRFQFGRGDLASELIGLLVQSGANLELLAPFDEGSLLLPCVRRCGG